MKRTPLSLVLGTILLAACIPSGDGRETPVTSGYRELLAADTSAAAPNAPSFGSHCEKKYMQVMTTFCYDSKCRSKIPLCNWCDGPSAQKCRSCEWPNSGVKCDKCQDGWAICSDSAHCDTHIQWDANNCGGCGNACKDNQYCNMGVCVCRPGFADCNGLAADGCEAVLNSDNTNCGSCGRACSCPSSSSQGQGPPQVPGLQLWLAADRNLNMGCSGGVCDCLQVSTWADSSGKGYTFLPQDGAVRFSTTPFPHLQFNGQWVGSEVNLHCYDASLAKAQVTNFVVVRSTAFSQDYSDILDYCHTGCQNYVLQAAGDNTFAVTVNNGQFIPVDGNFHVLTTGMAEPVNAAWGSQLSFSALDGANRFNAPAYPPCTPSWADGATLGIGGNACYWRPRYFIGDIAEVLIYNVALSQSDMESIEAYLKLKYSIP